MTQHPSPLSPLSRRGLTWWLSLTPALYLILPLALLHSALPSAFEAMRDPRCLSALWVSLSASALTSLLMVTLLTPLAWVLSGGALAQPSQRLRRLEALCLAPLALPPTVSGLALLLTFGRASLGDWSWSMSWAAVVGAQLFVAGPLYLRGASLAFNQLPRSLREVSLTLGASPRELFWRVALPLCAPALKSAALLAWLRAIGEFGATLLFAGNLQGESQTLPLAIYSLFELKVELAMGMALWLLWGAGLLSVALLSQAEVSDHIEP